jgi:Tol biopolymer transport system component/DNA-binding winged helix-turn-helix (wHTH) protein
VYDAVTRDRMADKICFGLYEFDRDAMELRKRGSLIRLQDQPARILAILAGRPGELVSREELQQQLWGNDTFVDFDQSLNKAVNRIREALDDDAGAPQYIETVPRRGYRFIAPVVDHGRDGTGPPKVSSANDGTLADSGCSPQPSVTVTAADRVAPSKWLRPRIAVIGPIFVVALIFGIWFLLPAAQPRVLKSTPLTNDGRTKCCPVTDGSRIYFSENYLGAGPRIQQIPVTGGDPTAIPLPSLEGDLLITDISRDHDRLLVEASVTGTDGTLWSVPLAASSPRPLIDPRAATELTGARWSPDGRTLVYTNGSALYLAQSDGSEPKRLVTAKGTVSYPAWSPDGKSLRFAVADSSRIGASTLFEISAQGGELHEVTPPWQNKSSECFGDWTPDGKYYLFLAGCNGRANIWAISEKGPFAIGRKREPVQLTAGPIRYGSFTFSPDGKKIFVRGSELRGVVERYDRKSAQFVPFRPALSADCCVYSNDGQWMAYVTFPEQSLWRSKPDGSQSQQLTWPPMQALNPHWSPDGKEIAFSAPSPGKNWKTFIVSAQGGAPRQLTQGECPELDANWSPDGTQLLYGSFPIYASNATCPAVLYTMDLKTHAVSAVPGSEGLFSPRWSPDGKTIVALNVGLNGMMIGDIASRKWSPLLVPLAGSALGWPQWSSDGSLVYYFRSFQAENAVYSIRIKDRKIEKVADLSGLQTTGSNQTNGADGTWSAVTPDGSPLILRDASLNEIYALDFGAP